MMGPSLTTPDGAGSVEGAVRLGHIEVLCPGWMACERLGYIEDWMLDLSDRLGIEDCLPGRF